MGILGGKRGATPPVATAVPACSDVRSAYNDCFNRWYSEKFSKGLTHKEKEEEYCVAEWNKYRACLEQHLEDKHLRAILLDSLTKPDAGAGAGAGAAASSTTA